MVGLYFKCDQNTKMHRIRLMWLCVWLGCLMSLSAMTISDLPTFHLSRRRKKAQRTRGLKSGRQRGDAFLNTDVTPEDTSKRYVASPRV